MCVFCALGPCAWVTLHTSTHTHITLVRMWQNIHDIEHDQAQFAVSAVVFPYPNDIYSVWVYMLSLVPKQMRRSGH